MNSFISIEQTFLALARIGFSPLGISGLSNFRVEDSHELVIAPEIATPHGLVTSVAQENQVIAEAIARDSGHPKVDA